MTVPQPVAGPSSDARNWAVVAHLSALALVVGIPSFVGPLIVWLVKRDDPFVAEHGREALNFNLSLLIYTVVGGIGLAVLAVATLGFGLLLLVPVVLGVVVAWLVLLIQASIQASRGAGYRYPLTLRLVT